MRAGDTTIPAPLPRGRASKLFAASAARVAPGGESGCWQWLVPTLVVMVVLFAAMSVRDEAGRADGASTAAAQAQAFNSALRESNALLLAVSASGRNDRIRAQALESIGRLQVAAAAFGRVTGGDSAAEALLRDSAQAQAEARRALANAPAGRQPRSTPKAPSLASLTGAAETVARHFDDSSRAASQSARQRLTMTLLGGGLLAILMLWSFFSKRARSTLDRSERRFRSLVEHSSELIAVVDAGRRVRFVTEEFQRRLGYETAALMGTNLLDLIHSDDRGSVVLGQASPAGKEPRQFRVAHSNGSWIEAELSSKDLRDDPAVRGYVISIRDVGQRRALEQQIRHQAFHDSLTGLANRALFEDRVSHALNRLRRDRRQGATVVFIDLDDFKTVNDSLGHAAGDELLRAFARCLADCTRRADTVARFGGDEFAVLVEGMYAPEAAAVIADRIHATLERPIALEQDEVFAHASIGIADGGPTATADDVIRNADLAMYAAKADGKGHTATYEPGMHEAARKRLQITGELRRALQDGQLSVAYQPLVRLDDGRMLGAEALARWTHPELGSVPPAEFIPLAEDIGLIEAIGSFVLNQACQQLKAWQTEHEMHPDYVSVNLSAKQFQREGHVVEEVRGALERAGLTGANLMLEITESILMHDREPIIRDLDALRALGIRIAIDDFGTGYSALSYLREFPIDTVKMDRSFVHNLGSNGADSALIRSVVELGEALDMQIIAEGIEGQGQLDSVTGLRCDVGQGYFFAPPLDAEGMRHFLNDAPAAAEAFAAAAAPLPTARRG